MKTDNFIIIGDSLAGQRKDDGYSLDERWPSIFETKSGFSVLNLAKTYSTTNTLKKLKKEIKRRKPDYVIIQLGIVDCVPRRLYKVETSILYRLPDKVRFFLIKIIKKIRNQSRSRAYVKPNKFKDNIKKFCLDMDCKFIYVKILSATEPLLLKNNNAGLSIIKYNKLIDEISSELINFTFVEVKEEIVRELTLDDGYHLNKLGHEYLADVLVNKFRNYGDV